jgi:hypothetical protein
VPFRKRRLPRKPQRHLVASSEHESRVVEDIRSFFNLGRGKCKTSCGKSSVMVDVKLLSLAMDLRARAREMLSRAETVYDTDSEQRMRAIAACHEKLAQRLEHGSVGDEHLQSDHATVRLGPPLRPYAQ